METNALNMTVAEPAATDESQPPTPARSRGDAVQEATKSAPWRESLRDRALQNAMQKRAAGVPTYSVPEAAALLSISQEYLYRLIQAGGFPAVRIRVGQNQGRYVVPAKALEHLLNEAASTSSCIEAADWASQGTWRP